VSAIVTSSAPSAVVSPPLDWQASVPTAFALGWQMSELFAMSAETPNTQPLAAANGSSPSAGHGLLPLASVHVWSDGDRWDLAARQIEGKACRLRAAFEHVGSEIDDLEKFESLAAGLVGHWHAAGADQELGAAYHALVMTLAAAHARLGRACELGCGLADLCRLAPGPTVAELKHRFGDRLTPLQADLTDLASSLPQHASRAISLSLAQWQKWARDADANAPVPHELPAILRRQGELWRAVLSGEKLGQDMLAADDYLDASKTLFRSVIGKRPWLWGALAGGAVLIAVGIYLILTASDALKAISGAGLSVLSAVGLTLASIKRSAAGVGDRLMSEVWSAELDWAIAQAVTVTPPGLSITLQRREVPPRGPDRSTAYHHSGPGAPI
jgi:hypothetical protein